MLGVDAIVDVMQKFGDFEQAGYVLETLENHALISSNPPKPACRISTSQFGPVTSRGGVTCGPISTIA